MARDLYGELLSRALQRQAPPGHLAAYITPSEANRLRSEGGGVAPDGGQYMANGIPTFQETFSNEDIPESVQDRILANVLAGLEATGRSTEGVTAFGPLFTEDPNSFRTPGFSQNVTANVPQGCEGGSAAGIIGGLSGLSGLDTLSNVVTGKGLAKNLGIDIPGLFISKADGGSGFDITNIPTSLKDNFTDFLPDFVKDQFNIYPSQSASLAQGTGALTEAQGGALAEALGGEGFGAPSVNPDLALNVPTNYLGPAQGIPTAGPQGPFVSEFATSGLPPGTYTVPQTSLSATALTPAQQSMSYSAMSNPSMASAVSAAPTGLLGAAPTAAAELAASSMGGAVGAGELAGISQMASVPYTGMASLAPFAGPALLLGKVLSDISGKESTGSARQRLYPQYKDWILNDPGRFRAEIIHKPGALGPLYEHVYGRDDQGLPKWTEAERDVFRELYEGPDGLKKLAEDGITYQEVTGNLALPSDFQQPQNLTSDDIRALERIEEAKAISTPRVVYDEFGLPEINKQHWSYGPGAAQSAEIACGII